MRLQRFVSTRGWLKKWNQTWIITNNKEKKRKFALQKTFSCTGTAIDRRHKRFMAIKVLSRLVVTGHFILRPLHFSLFLSLSTSCTLYMILWSFVIKGSLLIAKRCDLLLEHVDSLRRPVVNKFNHQIFLYFYSLPPPPNEMGGA